MKSKTLMIQGTTSDAGKTTLVAGLCRLFANQGILVAPLKPQNMALNSAVTACGGEIGRAQALQAKAANIDLDVDFNPILLKPNSDTGAQVIIHGKAITAMEAAQYQDYKKVAMDAVLASHKRLTKQYSLIVVEGAGSPAEINLREGDIANMGFAEAIDCPVIIIADIDKGGVFAQLVGTLMLLSKSEQDRVIGFVINRFRGDITLLEPGLTWLEQKTNKPVLGVLPYLHGLDISSEDALVTQQNNKQTKTKVKIVVLVYPRMSNHTDFDILRHHDELDCQFLFAKNPKIKVRIPSCDLIILPGSKSVIDDFKFLTNQGWHHDIAKHCRYGGKVIGICGGYQMLGREIMDPYNIEGKQSYSEGLNLFPMTTELLENKTLKNVEAQLSLSNKTAKVQGYEIHAGISTVDKQSVSDYQSLLTINGNNEGLVSPDNLIAGCYLHGLFDSPNALKLIMYWVGSDIHDGVSINDLEEIAINRISDACHDYLSISKINDLLIDWYKD